MLLYEPTIGFIRSVRLLAPVVSQTFGACGSLNTAAQQPAMQCIVPAARFADRLHLETSSANASSDCGAAALPSADPLPDQ